MPSIQDIIKNATQNVAEKKVFQSEAQFQFELAWEIKKLLELPINNNLKDWEVNLEYLSATFDYNGEHHRMFTDILLKNNKTNEYVPVELKHKLPSAPANLGRFDFWWDVHRVEWLKDNHLDTKQHKNLVIDKSLKGYKFLVGFAIIITSDKRYFTKTSREIISKNFELTDGLDVSKGLHSWVKSDNSSINDTWRDVDISLIRSYHCIWNTKPTGQTDTNKNEFKYLILEI